MLRESELEYLNSFVERTGGPLADDSKANQLSNSRGDVRSRAGFIDSVFSVRIVRLVEYAIDERLTRAAWPVWGAAIRSHREATSALMRRALPRVRTLYRECVGLVVTLALAADALIVGTKVGLPLAGKSPGGWVAALFAGALLATVVVTVRLLVSFCQSLERPLGSEPTDMPALSYVMAAAEISLRQIQQPSEKMRDAYQLFTGIHELHGAGRSRAEEEAPPPGTADGDDVTDAAPAPCDVPIGGAAPLASTPRGAPSTQRGPGGALQLF